MASRLHRLFVRAPIAPPVDMSGRRVVVTGAAAGSIGAETARILASWGADVVVTTRTAPHEAAARLTASLRNDPAAGTIDAHALDLVDVASVRAFTSWYERTHGDELDVLVNNAGIHLDLLARWKEPHLSDDGHELQWRTNYLGTLQLTWLLLPSLRRAGERTGDARIVNVASRLHARGTNTALLNGSTTYNSWTAYGLSKLALIHATNELQRRAAGSHVQAYSLHPGEVFTGIATQGLAGHRWIGGVRHALRPLEATILMTPFEGAQTSVYVASQPGLEGGRYYVKCRPAQPSPDANDAQAAAVLWQRTQDWISEVSSDVAG